MRGDPVSDKTDVYAFGLTLYELLCGAPPFRNDSREATLAAQLDDAPPRLRRRRRGIPKGVQALVSRALAKQPEPRPFMSNLLNDLDDAASRPVTSWQRVAAVVGGVLVLASMAIPLVWDVFTPRPELPDRLNSAAVGRHAGRAAGAPVRPSRPLLRRRPQRRRRRPSRHPRRHPSRLHPPRRFPCRPRLPRRVTPHRHCRRQRRLPRPAVVIPAPPRPAVTLPPAPLVKRRRPRSLHRRPCAGSVAIPGTRVTARPSVARLRRLEWMRGRRPSGPRARPSVRRSLPSVPRVRPSALRAAPERDDADGGAAIDWLLKRPAPARGSALSFERRCVYRLWRQREVDRRRRLARPRCRRGLVGARRRRARRVRDQVGQVAR